MSGRAARCRLLLLGGGHAQLAVLAWLARERPAGVEAVLVTPQPRQVYSGMLPGWLAGHYTEAQCVIALAPLAQAAGVTLRRAAAVGLDADARQVRLDDGSTLDYDWLSVNTGPAQDVARWGVAALRPIEGWLARTRQRLARAGLPLPETLPPRAMAEQVRARFGTPANAVANWLLRLEQLRYAPKPTQELSQLRREFRQLPWPGR